MASTSANTVGYEIQDRHTHASEGDANRPSTSATPSFTVSSQSLNPRSAFEDLAPSTSTSGRSKMGVKKVPYDVFINHRGPDVKEGLASDLYNTLNVMGLRVFLDKEELEVGDSFPREIEEAISGASLHLAIFSQNYAQSAWCLAELSLMLKTGTKVIPIFYHIQTDVVRYAKGTYAEAFSRYEQKGRYSSTTVQEWKDALRNVSYNIGYIIETKDDETLLLKNIVNYAVKEIKNVPLVVAKHPVGLDEAVEDFEMTTFQYVEQYPTVQIVGIWGMGGVGKTTLAKKLYNNKYKTMERCSFLFDIRDAADKSVLHLKQKKLLEDLGFKGRNVENVEEGKGLLARHLRCVRVLIVLDDVDNVEQLDALIPEKDYLRQGSLIVVTSRKFDVLISWGISSSSVYKMKGLNPSHCQQLFCWHAFLQPFPKDGFADLAKKFIDACHGLPLSLKVFGGQLYGKTEQCYWESQLEKIVRILPDDIRNMLEVCYDALDNEVKAAFLDVACFFLGEQKSLAIEVWNGSEGGGSGLCSWEMLVNRCLVEVDGNDCIRMHDHLRDLGRDISYQQLPHRLWFPDQTSNVENQTEVRKIPDLLSTLCSCFPWHIIMNVKKKISIRGIMATSTRLKWDNRLYALLSAAAADVSPFPIMMEHDESSRQGRRVVFNTNEGIWTLSPSLHGLKFIMVEGDDLNKFIGEASRELVWLRWFPAGQGNLPSQLSMKKLRVLEIFEKYQKDNHFQELWKDASDAPIQLSVLFIDNCIEFQRFPESIGSLKHLKKIVISKAVLESLPRGFCLLKSLEHLDLSCELSALPDNFGDLRNLRYLRLSGCLHLKRLPVSFKRLTLLQHLHLENLFELTFESDIMEDMTKLEYVGLNGCRNLEELPPHITNQRSLIKLHLHTESLWEVPVKLGQLSKLQKLSIHSKLLTWLPTSLGDLFSLTVLEIYGCQMLEFLPDSLGRLSMLEDLNIRSSGVKSLSVGGLINLQKLRINGCPISEFELVPGSFASSLCNLKHIHLSYNQVYEVSISEDCCPGLESFSLWSNSHVTDIQVLPKTLVTISLEKCPKLEGLPSFAQFSSLRKFELEGCYRIKKIHKLEHCTALEELKAETMWEEAGIESLESSERMRKVELKAISRSGVESCLESMKKWPKEELMVCTRAVPDAATVVNTFDFSNVFVVDSFSNQEIESEASLKWPSPGRCILLCFVVDCKSPTFLVLADTLHSSGIVDNSLQLEKGKWVWTVLLIQHSMIYNYISLYTQPRVKVSGGGLVERELIMTGEPEKVREAFTHLLSSLCN